LINLLPPNKKFTFTGDDVNFIIIQIEKQGGNRKYVHYINKRIEEVIARSEMK
jgi:hypothetical protein